ncbi:MAG: FtsQ-type POTRA domain-containing protein [Sutterellaceae bacterium]|nr:FtsQ-type POTRA domain-containing protein [Burkholderiaceae bacterium]MDW8429368.1 FtsQ-type POTRA domain-containing protein [Sutterellaceae bacterium]
MSALQLMQWTTRLLLAAAAAMLLFGILRWAAAHPRFELRRIEVRGEVAHVSAAAVRAALAGRLQGGFFAVSLPQLRQALEAIPWVAAVSVRRVFPDRLVVTLREHRALGVWSDGRLLADDGRLFAANVAEAELDGPVVQFDGPPRLAPEAARRYAEIAAALAPLALTVAALEISERGALRVVTDSGLRLELGRDEPPGRLRESLARLAAVYPYVLAQLGEPPRGIDLRYPNGMAVAPRRGAASAAGKS